MQATCAANCGKCVSRLAWHGVPLDCLNNRGTNSSAPEKRTSGVERDTIRVFSFPPSVYFHYSDRTAMRTKRKKTSYVKKFPLAAVQESLGRHGDDFFIFDDLYAFSSSEASFSSRDSDSSHESRRRRIRGRNNVFTIDLERHRELEDEEVEHSSSSFILWRVRL